MYVRRVAMNGMLEEPKGGNEQERWKAVSELRRLGPQAVDYLIINLWDHDKMVRMAAADALGSIGDPRAYEHLVPLLEDPDHDIRFACVNALGNLGDERATGPLKKACRDKNGYVRTIAAEILEKMLSAKKDSL
jgi:HEAT repeat protein